ncbi:hypothetical protein KKH38_04895 [Patescibacteria group bacterium]|nr:hypothetical protein [Patescibacteria group bacterium]MBU4601239.1 hypothetical protein [Patescibacteria group bacterium]MCG2697494.1 hypothetical protein [Candidatus Parcubacteria bacterium]
MPDQPRVPLEYIKRVHNDYKKIKQQDAIIAIEKFSVDYMVVNANYDQKTFLMIEKDNNVKKIVTINNYSIYEFVN